MAEVRILADENIPAGSVRMLRQAGLNVDYVQELHSGASDFEVLEIARRESRVLLTLDRDFGQLVFHAGNPAPDGVVYFRLIPASPEDIAGLMLRLLEERTRLVGMFTVCDGKYVRQRPLVSDAG